jgi:hypothetical protein
MFVTLYSKHFLFCFADVIEPISLIYLYVVLSFLLLFLAVQRLQLGHTLKLASLLLICSRDMLYNLWLIFKENWQYVHHLNCVGIKFLAAPTNVLEECICMKINFIYVYAIYL